MSCFRECLIQDVEIRRSTHWPVLRTVGQLAIPFIIAVGVVIGVHTFVASSTSTESDDQLLVFFVTGLKLGSIGLLAYHTQGAIESLGGSVKSTYQMISLYMVCVVVLLCGYLILLASPATLPKLAPYAGRWGVSYLVAIVSFLYQVLFLIKNKQLIRQHRGDIRFERFAHAFIFGVNIPSLIAFAAVLITPPIAIYVQRDSALFLAAAPETFLSGAIALLVYSSTAAAILVDHYAQPFLKISCVDCTLVPSLSTADGVTK